MAELRVLDTGGRLVAASHGDALRVWDVERGACAFAQPRAHERRIKALAALGAAPAGGAVVASASSDGTIRVWRVPPPPAAATKPRAAEVGALELLLTIPTQLRLTCLTARRVGGGGGGGGVAVEAAADADAADDEDEDLSLIHI